MCLNVCYSELVYIQLSVVHLGVTVVTQRDDVIRVCCTGILVVKDVMTFDLAGRSAGLAGFVISGSAIPLSFDML